MTSDQNRRNFLGTAAGAAAFTILPKHVLGGPNTVAPSGSVDWKKLFAAAKTGGVKNYYVEMNLESMQASVPYLHSLKT